MSLLSPDLTHADWWVRTSTKLLQKVDTSLRFTVVKVGQTQHLMVENISEATLSKLFFLVNTDQNNNYGYLEALQVFVKGDYSRTAIPIPGFSTLANAIWNEADAIGFVEGQKTQTAFLAPLNNPYTNEPITIPEYVDWITAVIPWAPKTFGKEKIFTLMLNPDTEYSRDGGKTFMPINSGSFNPNQIVALTAPAPYSGATATSSSSGGTSTLDPDGSTKTLKGSSDGIVALAKVNRSL
jgi:hypothetical protein